MNTTDCEYHGPKAALSADPVSAAFEKEPPPGVRPRNAEQLAKRERGFRDLRAGQFVDPAAKPARLFGWYSAQMAQLTGTNIYSTPSGGEMHITCVTSDPKNSGARWADMQPVGEVVSWVRVGRRSADPFGRLGE